MATLEPSARSVHGHGHEHEYEHEPGRGVVQVADEASSALAGGSASHVPGSSEGADASGQGGKPQAHAHAHDERERAAAVVIQRHYRGYATRKRIQRIKMEPQARWNDLLKTHSEKQYADGQLSNKNDVKSRWQRGVHAAARMQNGAGVYTSPPSSSKSPPPSASAPAPPNPALADRDLPELSVPRSGTPSSSRDVGVGRLSLDEAEGAEMDKTTRKARRARFWGKMTLPRPSEMRGEGGGDGEKGQGEGELPFRSKALEQQHWLEMVDHKHRYGSNLKFYFRKWKEADTQDNFFRWLDIGGGKDLDLEELPRERLEKELITYLSAEQRLNYLVKLDKDGLLRWARNDELVDTAAGKWRDSGDGTGIIPDETYTGMNPITEEQAYASRHYRMRRRGSNSGSASGSGSGSGGWGGGSDSSLSLSSDSYSAGSELHENQDSHYTEMGAADEKGLRAKWKRGVKGVTPAGVRDDLLRKTIRRNTWIYACDVRLNMFVGIKRSGTFQHSSFLAGGKVTSAGILVVKNGVIKSLMPWSGHYRSTIDHYRSFIAQLEKKGADLSHVKVGKSVMQMWGLAKYTALTKRPGKLAWSIKKKLGLEHEPSEMEASREVLQRGDRELEKQRSGPSGGEAGGGADAEAELGLGTGTGTVTGTGKGPETVKKEGPRDVDMRDPGEVARSEHEQGDGRAGVADDAGVPVYAEGEMEKEARRAERG